ncbi:hypothetical protein VTN77DRAFT_2023 [Rasamsonia byssochlamydoides]|uniref:uncharacterized protein n=1 Tax=Rasamsonia byssochlamydoides TaxID=89139 RepID=UPI0037432A4B
MAGRENIHYMLSLTIPRPRGYVFPLQSALSMTAQRPNKIQTIPGPSKALSFNPAESEAQLAWSKPGDSLATAS